ncbi:MAG TPA: 2Fe-2S iron-sulfur cluster-binding protein [Spirochaetota bacterium]|nr:2Fe-2S iron-sulfur cluster-binding protein [Spirochaetota bacterium]HPQ52946.1 2Fe-2S iron-sulfur cluster-binding protein [Spirochaetota bacterium]
MSDIKFTIDGKECSAKSGQTIVEAAKDNGVYIPTLCHFDGLKPAGTCRICTVKVGGRNMAACTTPVTNGMVVENKTPELEDARKAIIEMLFVEGNHMCPTCEKSGNCELQALGYRYLMMVPRFPFLFPKRAVDASSPKLYIDKNRCVQCLRCVRGVTSADGRKVFGLVMRGGHAQISMDNELVAQLSDAEALKAMELCPVGAILRKEVGYAVPIGKRKYDTMPIGSDIEK